MTSAKLFKRIILIGCSCATIFYCTLLIHKYSKNESLTQINVRQLSNCEYGCYPSTTICLYADQGNLLQNLAVPMKKKCFEVMKGTINDENDLKLCDFKNATLPVKSYVNNITFESMDESKWSYDLDEINDTYTDPNDQCFTINPKSNNASGITRINLELVAEKLIGLAGGKLRIFLHHPGQFLRNSMKFGNPVFIIENLNPLTVAAKSDITIRITHTELTINREDGETKCTNRITNHDEYWLNSLRELVGCNPLYWKYIWNETKFPECKNSTSLKNFYEYQKALSQSYSSKKVEKMFIELSKKMHPPCNFLELTTEWQNNNSNSTMENTGPKKDTLSQGQNPNPDVKSRVNSTISKIKSDTLKIELLFSSTTYEERLEIRAYDSSSLFAEMGGYIGLFLGLSILQGLGHGIDFVVWIRKAVSSSNAIN